MMMRIERAALPAIALTLLSTIVGVAAALPIGGTAPDFTLSDLNGRSHSLRDYRGRNVILTFLAAKCPISKAYHERIRLLARDFGQRPDTVLLGINSSADESLAEIRASAERNGLDFPILRDEQSAIADAFGAERTPDVYVIDAAGRLRYRGRIDSSHIPRREMRHDLREALREMFAGQPVTIAETIAMGCPIVRQSGRQNAAPTGPARSAKPAGQPAVKTVGQTAAPTGEVRLLKPAAYRKMVGAVPGKVVIVNFWATWCGPCVAEFPELVRLDELFRDRGVRFVGISADDVGDLKEKVVPFLRAQRVKYENYLQEVDDPQEMIDVVDKEWPGTLPATFVYDQTGKLRFQRLGIIDRETLVTEIEKLLKK